MALTKIFLPILSVALFSCGGGMSTSGDSESDPSGDDRSDTAADPGADPVSDPGPDPDAIPDADPEVVPDIVEENPVTQNPITFIIRNTSEETVYVDWVEYGRYTIRGDRTTGGAWMSHWYWNPTCMEKCENFDPDEECCVACEQAEPMVRELGGNEQIERGWDGQNIFIRDDDHCTCPCYRTIPPPAMAFRARVCTYDDFTCTFEPCSVDEDGVHHGAEPTGDPSCFDPTFDIPYPHDEFVIEVN